MNTIVTKRFIDCHKYLIDHQICRSSAAFADRIGVHKQGVNDIIHGKRDVTVEMLRKTCEVFDINPDYLLLGVGDIIKDKSKYNFRKNNILFVPIRARAGYSMQNNDPLYLNDLESFRLPDSRFAEGEFRCFEIEGDSMEPTFYDGELVICSPMEPVYFSQTIKSNSPYVIITEADILLKRLVNNIEKDKTIDLVSDNSYYPITKLKIQSVRELWRIEGKLIKGNFSAQRSN